MMLSWLRPGQRPSDASVDAAPRTGQVPPGIPSTPLLGQTLSFHDAAHDDVCGILTSIAGSEAEDSPPLRTVRLNVIGRNIALVTSYDTASRILDQQWSDDADAVALSRNKAYDQLMSAFFSPPNLLLEDEDDRDAEQHQQQWAAVLQDAETDTTIATELDAVIVSWIKELPTGSSVELYDVCKDLGHRLALGTFLGLNPDHQKFSDAKAWSDEMLRGQFSLPFGINIGLFRNAFSKGQAAKKKYDTLVAEQMPMCPFAPRLQQGSASLSEASMQSHLSMFSSSLVVKAFASLAMALLLQLYRNTSGEMLADHVRRQGADNCQALLDSIITETVRLSPPIIGVMRRVTRKEGLDLHSEPGITIPCGWDVWPYFPLANRDPKVYSMPHSFNASRFITNDSGTPPAPLSFGAGVKACTGRDMVRAWLEKLARAVIFDSGSEGPPLDVRFAADDMPPGVRQWLGWEGDARISWRSVKQLPTQRPRAPILVDFCRRQ